MAEMHGCGADAAAYALGALEPAEADAFRRHMGSCAVCQDEVASFQQAVSSLPLSARQHPAPRRLRRQVMLAVGAEPRAARTSPRRPMPRIRMRLASPGLAGAAALAATTAAIVSVTLSGGSTTRTSQASVHGLPGSAQLRVTGGHAELVVSHLAPPPAGHIYEVWLKRPGQAPAPTSALFSVTTSGSGDVAVPGDLRGVNAVLVTPEPDGGSQRPTHAPVIVAALSPE